MPSVCRVGSGRSLRCRRVVLGGSWDWKLDPCSLQYRVLATSLLVVHAQLMSCSREECSSCWMLICFMRYSRGVDSRYKSVGGRTSDFTSKRSGPNQGPSSATMEKCSSHLCYASVRSRWFNIRSVRSRMCVAVGPTTGDARKASSRNHQLRRERGTASSSSLW